MTTQQLMTRKGNTPINAWVTPEEKAQSLMKLWLTNDERFAGFDEMQTRRTIAVVLSRIQETQQAMLKLLIKVQGE